MPPLKRRIGPLALDQVNPFKVKKIVELVDSDEEEGRLFELDLPQEDTEFEYLQDTAIAQLLAIFPDLCPHDAAQRVSELGPNVSNNQALERIIEHYLVHGIVKATDNNPGTSFSEKFAQTNNNDIDIGTIDTAKDADDVDSAGVLYSNWCLFRLSSDFPQVKMADLRQALKSHNGRLSPAYKDVFNAFHYALNKEKKLSSQEGLESSMGKAKSIAELKPKQELKLSRFPRFKTKDPPAVICPVFEKQYHAVLKECAATQEMIDKDIAEKLNKEEHQLSGQDIECGCCYSEFQFEEMVQCADGHLFCFGCLRRRVEESTFGGLQASSSLPCMDTNGCIVSFPVSEVKRALPEDMFLKYEQRQAEDAVARARLDGLIYCPFCNLPCVVDAELLILDCPNASCKKVSCIKCKEPSHVPLRCEEVEKKSETLLRKRIEESMSKALIRECSSCKAELIKCDGCNKITCRCGQIMCYICRKPIAANYSHFCQHVREPGKQCFQCNRCSLWETEREDEVIKAAKEAALEKIAEMEPEFVKRPIGPNLNLVKCLSAEYFILWSKVKWRWIGSRVELTIAEWEMIMRECKIGA